MTSENIYIQTVPYFYIIQHKITKKMYAGSKWAVGCHPDTFMVKTGYTTSSTLINSIIDSEGLNSFIILRLDTNLDGLSAYNYESLFLQTLDCFHSPDWFNQHNNIGMALGTELFYNQMQQKYGYTNAQQIPEIKEQTKQTNQDRYGYDYTLQCPEIKEKSNKTIKYIYGVDNVSQSPIIKDKKKQSSQINFGVDNISQSPIIKEKKRQSSQDKFGYNTPLQCPEVKEKIKQTNLLNTGYDNLSKRPFICIIDNKKTYAKNTASKYYPELKPFL